MKKLLFSGLLMLISASQSLFAVQAKRDVIRTLTQPDGTTVQVQLVGDETSHCYITTDKVPVMQAADGRWCIATIDAAGRPVASDVLAANPAERTAEQRSFIASISAEAVGNAIFTKSLNAPRSRAPKAAATDASSTKGIGLFDEVLFPSDGERHALVILVQYLDIKFTINNAGDYFDRFLNEEGFKDNGATGSVRDFYVQGSNGSFKPHFDVYGPVTLSNRRSYYGGNDAFGTDLRPCQMVKEACEKLDDQINFADYDLDGDGAVDNVYVIYAGQGEADYGSAECIWPHRWTLGADNVTCSLDGKKIDNYGCCNEWGDGHATGIGTFCHEFGHVMGLPDLYATTYNSATSLTPGPWSVMDYGSYLNDGRTPPTFSSFERNALGWIEPTQLKEAASVELKNLHDSNEAFIITTDKNTEFFLLENRQQTGWDKYLPGHGMLVWHIDYDRSAWNNNKVNNTASHQYVDIVEASGLSDNTNDNYLAGYSFPGTSRVTDFTQYTSPALKTWAGRGIDVPVTGITEKDGVIFFDVCGGALPTEAPVVELSGITSTSFVLSWKAIHNAKAYIVNVTDADGNSLEGYPVSTDRTDCKVRDLEPETKYFATVYGTRGEESTESCEPIEVTTAEYSFVWVSPVALDATEVSAKQFTANWKAIEGAVDYRLTVITNSPVSTETENCEFTTSNKFVSTQGWTTTAEGVYESKDYVGESSPSLKFSKHGLYLCSPVYNKEVTKLTFWYRGAGSDVSNYLEIQARASEDDEWTLVHTVQPLIITKGGETVTVDNFPNGMHQIRIQYFKPKNGNVALDDVVVTLGGNSLVFHADYNEKSVGNVVSHIVNAPDSNATEENPVTMYYSVRGVNSLGETSASSALVAVSLGISNGIADIETGVVENDITDLYDLNGRRITGQPAAGIYLIRRGNSVTKVIVK